IDPKDLPETSNGVKLEDFHAYMPMHSYIYAPTREMWPATSVNSRIPPVSMIAPNGETAEAPANKWLDVHRPVEQMTWVPGKPMIIEDQIISDGGWIAHPKARCFNLYRPPVVGEGDPSAAVLWTNHIHKLFDSGAEHIINWLAQRVQRPWEKINHALVL